MAQLAEHHKTLTNGVGKCSKPMWRYPGVPAGFCNRDAYGRPTLEGLRLKEPGYVPALACPEHGGPSEKGASDGS